MIMKKALALLLLAQNANAFSAAPSAATTIAAALGPSKPQTRLFNAPRHDVRSGGNVEMDPEEMKIQQALAEHQQNAVRSRKLQCILYVHC
jgi:hypothetical protein